MPISLSKVPVGFSVDEGPIRVIHLRDDCKIRKYDILTLGQLCTGGLQVTLVDSTGEESPQSFYISKSELKKITEYFLKDWH